MSPARCARAWQGGVEHADMIRMWTRSEYRHSRAQEQAASSFELAAVLFFSVSESSISILPMVSSSLPTNSPWPYLPRRPHSTCPLFLPSTDSAANRGPARDMDHALPCITPPLGSTLPLASDAMSTASPVCALVPTGSPPACFASDDWKHVSATSVMPFSRLAGWIGHVLWQTGEGWVMQSMAWCMCEGEGEETRRSASRTSVVMFDHAPTHRHTHTRTTGERQGEVRQRFAMEEGQVGAAPLGPWRLRVSCF